MPVRRCLVPLLVLLNLAACGTEPTAEGPPTGIDLDVPITELSGWEEVKQRIGEPAESTRLEVYLEFWREWLDLVRRNPDPVERQAQEDERWRAAEGSLTSMVGADNAQILLEWMESTFGRWTGGAP